MGKLETIYWNKESVMSRQAVVELCGWITKEGKITMQGMAISLCPWQDLASATRRTLTGKGIKPKSEV